MSTTSFWLAVFGGMLVTFATRVSFFALPHLDRLPPLFLRGLRFVPAAVLGALLATLLATPVAELGWSTAWPRLAAAAVAGVAGLRTRNTWITIGLGMVTLWGLQAILR